MKTFPATSSAAALLLLLCGMAATAASAQQCKPFTRFMAVAGSGAVMDVVEVPDTFPVGSVAVSGIDITHPSVGSLQVTLLHRAPGGTANTAVVLKGPNAGAAGANMASTGFADSAAAAFPAGAEAAPFAGTFKPALPLAGFAGQPAAGTWVLRVADLSKEAAQQSITLSGWSLSICPGPAVAAAAGPDAGMMPPPPPLPAVNVSLAAGGLAVNVTGTNNTFRLGVTNGSVEVSGMSGASERMMNLLFPFQSPDVKPGPVAAAVLTAKDAGRTAVSSHIGDAILFAQRQSGLIKDTINAKLARLVNTVNAGNAATQNLLTNGASQLKSSAGSLKGDLLSLQGAVARHQGLKAAVKEDMQNKIQHALGLLSTFTAANAAVVGNMGSTLMMVKDAATARAKAVVDTYQTAEGIAKSHVDNIIITHVGLLNNKLDKIIAALTAAQSLTGPVLDAKINLDKAALAKLATTLDTVAAAAKAMPAPSKALQAKTGALASLLGNTRIGGLVSDPEKAVADLLGKVSQAQALLKSRIG